MAYEWRSSKRGCEEKINHKTQDEAEESLKKTLLITKKENPERMMTYKCSFCEFWHVGHRKSEYATHIDVWCVCKHKAEEHNRVENKPTCIHVQCGCTLSPDSIYRQAIHAHKTQIKRLGRFNNILLESHPQEIRNAILKKSIKQLRLEKF